MADLPSRCPMCGRSVKSYFDHVASDCMNWPEKPERGSVTYRSFVVEPNDLMPGYWQYVHVNYDGPEDNRAGTETTFEDCLIAIDERFEDES